MITHISGVCGRIYKRLIPLFTLISSVCLPLVFPLSDMLIVPRETLQVGVYGLGSAKSLSAVPESSELSGWCACTAGIHMRVYAYVVCCVCEKV